MPRNNYRACPNARYRLGGGGRWKTLDTTAPILYDIGMTYTEKEREEYVEWGVFFAKFRDAIDPRLAAIWDEITNDPSDENIDALRTMLNFIEVETD
jgi:hypothetical protein